MLSYSDLQSAHAAAASATLTSWSKMPTEDSKISRLLFWWLTLDSEFERHVYNSTVIKGELSPLLDQIPNPDDPTDPLHIAAMLIRDAIILPMPILPVRPLVFATALEVSVHTFDLNTYDRNFKLFHAQQLAMDSLKSNMLSSLDETTKSICFPDKTQLNTITFFEIYNRVANNFNSPTPAHIDAVNLILAEPFTYLNANSYDLHIARHQDAHRALEAMVFKKRPLEMCNDFRQSLLLSEHAAEFRPFLTIYDAVHLSLHEQSLEDIQRACLPAIAHITAKVVQASTNQFAVNAVITPPTPPPKPTGGTKRWCWTHGTMFHSSDRCKKPAPGHQKTATITNKMGSTK
jgi:hypothetical protein